ncbi:MAG: hypothetical protein OSA97_06645, partial [Nevskia sp.]|nr:hypothetical protein [Nevskia sp.]
MKTMIGKLAIAAVAACAAFCGTLPALAQDAAAPAAHESTEGLDMQAARARMMKAPGPNSSAKS